MISDGIWLSANMMVQECSNVMISFVHFKKVLFRRLAVCNLNAAKELMS